MSETRFPVKPLSFNGSLRIDASNRLLTANPGALLLREVDERLGATEALAARLHDPRSPQAVVHPLIEVIRARTYLAGQGHGDQSDADLHASDPAFKLAVASRKGLAPLGEDVRLPSQPTISRVTSILASEANLETLRDGVFDFAARDFRARSLGSPVPPQSVTIDLDSCPIVVSGQQPGSAYNGHYKIPCFNPLFFMLGEQHLVLHAILRPGNVHTADGAKEALEKVITNVESRIAPVRAVRGDAGFPCEPLLAMLESRQISYACRIAANSRLKELASPFLVRPVGRPPLEPREWYHELKYRANSWSRERRVVLVVIERPYQLLLDYFFIVTGWSPSEVEAREVLSFYRQRGTMEAHLGEIKSVLAPTPNCTVRTRKKGRRTIRQPKEAERASDATLQIFMLAYNLMNTARHALHSEEKAAARAEGRREEPPAWSLARLRACILLAAARVVVSGRRATFSVCRSVSELWGRVLRGIVNIPHLSTG